jgi:hypothetical protein
VRAWAKWRATGPTIPLSAIWHFTGGFEDDLLHGSLQIIGKLKGTFMGRAIEGTMIKILYIVTDRYGCC